MTAFPVGLLTTRAKPRADPRGRLWQALAVAAVIVATVVSVKVALSATQPSFPYDEIDQLQMSRMLAGFEPPRLRGAGYYPAWSFLLTPLWWFTSDAFLVYRVAIGLSVALGLAAIWPLSRIAARFRVTTAQSVVAAAIAVTLPAIAIQSDYALSERMLFLVIALAVLAAWRLWEKPTVVRVLLFTLALGLMYFTHVRVAAIVLASAVWLVLFALRNWRVALIGLVALGALYFAVGQIAPELNVALLGNFSQGENLQRTIEDARGGTIARVAFGQAWTQVVGTLGLVVIGFVGLVVLSLKELRRLRVGRASYLLAICAAMYLLTVLNWSSDWHLFLNPWRRLDTWLYGRYIDPVMTILALVGAVLLIRGIRLALLLWSAAISAVVLAITTFWVSLDAPTWGYVTPAHIGGVMPWYWLLPTTPFPEGARIMPTLWNENRFWLWASLTVVAAFVVYFLLRRLRMVLAVFLIAVVAAMSIVADGASDDFHVREGMPPAELESLRDALADTGPVSLQFATQCSGDGAYDSVVVNYYGYWLLPSTLETFKSQEQDGSAELIISCGTAPPAGVDDAEILQPSWPTDYSLWVRPGPLSDRLHDEGVLPQSGTTVP